VGDFLLSHPSFFFPSLLPARSTRWA
jgi:hypothetical protein